MRPFLPVTGVDRGGGEMRILHHGAQWKGLGNGHSKEHRPSYTGGELLPFFSHMLIKEGETHRDF